MCFNGYIHCRFEDIWFNQKRYTFAITYIRITAIEVYWRYLRREIDCLVIDVRKLRETWNSKSVCLDMEDLSRKADRCVL